jgi:FKBP-type peptidyl-prolyl cis-trans isomerase SlyD
VEIINKSKVVQMNYVLRDSEGSELDRSPPGEPFEYLQGADQIVPGLERELQGLKKGDKKKVIVQPKEGYGEVDPNLRAELNRSVFPKEMPIEIGIEFRAQLEQGPTILRIEQVNGDTITVDGNHPLAGKTLEFDVEIVNVRSATSEELEHGHAHGPGGHGGEHEGNGHHHHE